MLFSIKGLISETELGAQSVIYEVATIAYMVRNTEFIQNNTTYYMHIETFIMIMREFFVVFVIIVEQYTLRLIFLITTDISDNNNLP